MDDAFWLRYLRAHADPRTRAIHTAGTIAATAVVAVAIARRLPLGTLLGLACGYGPAWLAHAFIEHNRPETFSRPFSSLAADYRMAFGLLTGTLAPELERAGVALNS
jgi:hypothetical protein